MCRAEFVDYANKIRDYCNKLSEIGEIAHIEIFESCLAEPTDMMMDMLFALVLQVSCLLHHSRKQRKF